MRIITLNANGIRSAARKGFFDWLERRTRTSSACRKPRASATSSSDPLFRPAGYHCYYFDATKKGYSGVGALFARQAGRRRDRLRLAASSTPKGATSRRSSRSSASSPSTCRPARRARTGSWRSSASSREFMPYLRALKRRRRDYILCGDWNIAHKPIDLRNWKSNQKNSGFLPEERAWLDELFGDVALRRCVPRSQPGSRPLHLVVESRRRPGPRTSAGASTTRC